jgi:topoisomerase-4 subunit A
MTDLLDTPPNTPDELPNDDSMLLADYAQRAYLEYALSVVKGRALPDACDGQKPVQRRILYSMARMGLSFGGANGATGAKPVKSARVVGDVLGRFHPHSDQAAYDALVRMAQDFSQRYPLIDGQGNFGSRDGDGAAAMRYTEARLAKITTLLMDEIDQGTVDFIPNYDGSTEEPRQLPSRLPFTLLNGASGIAVGMATEIPSHNLGEVAAACVALIKNPKLLDSELYEIIPAPDYPGGGQIISSSKEISDAYSTGRGSLKVRARWKIEDLARGQWQLVVNELPPGVSTQKVLEEIDEITNPKIKAGKKTLSNEQNLLKASILAVLDTVRDESDKDSAVRLVFEPKSSRIEVNELVQALLAHTSLETSVPINLTAVGLDGKPAQKSLKTLLQEWVAFRRITVQKRTEFRLGKVKARIHILEGRQIVLLNIDEVIRIIRESDEPKSALIAKFNLSDIQAEDILEIRLRQLARLEAIKIEQELKELRAEQAKLEDILASSTVLNRLLIKEIEQDSKQFADARRTLIQEEKRVVAEVKVIDEPVTVVISEKGWVRARTAHGHDPQSFAFKSGDALYGTFECRTIDTFIIFGNKGRVYSVPVAALPGARGDGQPITSLIDLEPGTQIVHFYAGAAQNTLLLSSTGGYGFMATVESMTTRLKAGKTFLACAENETITKPSIVLGSATAANQQAATHVAAVSYLGRIITFEISELKLMTGGGKGLMLISLEDKDSLAGAAAYTRSIKVSGIGRGGKVREESFEIRSLNNAKAPRGRKGKAVELGFKVNLVERVE